MTRFYRYLVSPDVPAADATAALTLAGWAAESLHGARARLDAGPRVDRRRMIVEVPAGTPAGRDLGCLFVGFLTRGFGPDAVRVETDPPVASHKPVRRAGR
ncbi:hypothetical protein [Fimbriiglobus ruber]|uniref:Uncharacterized protein n=1 Tax=Fimbriiglobus ruber TaxID=1908690 RepID=A0A225DI89_9BACT|nr:hypothetical protein [Fimbriiglobus ruber]OWK39414.1 hypothetical protein FRUB_05977 [Fimbriiglobus ruber]